MKKIVIVSILCLLTGLLTSCHDEKGADINQLKATGILSFVINTDNSEYYAAIDQNKKEINISGIKRASHIKSVSVELSEGYSIYPNPNAVKSWHTTQTFTIIRSGADQVYHCNLPDLIEEVDKDYIVMGYLTANANSFETMYPTIDLSNLTHLLVCFGNVYKDGTVDFSNLNANITQLIETTHAAGKKILLSVHKAGDQEFAGAMETAEKRTKVVNQIIGYVNDRGLDGFDIDFEDYNYINSENTRKNLISFIKELHEKKEPDMLMTCAVSPYPSYGPEWAQYFDYINLMSYDIRSNNTYKNFTDQIDMIVTELQLSDYSKLVGGVPFYGRDDSRPGSDVNSKAITYGSILKQYGIEAADKDIWDQTYYNGRPTIRQKCQYAKEIGLAGIMIWELLQDTNMDGYKLLDVVGEEMFPK